MRAACLRDLAWECGIPEAWWMWDEFLDNTKPRPCPGMAVVSSEPGRKMPSRRESVERIWNVPFGASLAFGRWWHAWK